MSLPLGKLPRNSMHAYTEAISTSISQCKLMESHPYRWVVLRQFIANFRVGAKGFPAQSSWMDARMVVC
jgi:hypothetical protein